MIHSLCGKVLSVSKENLVLDVAGFGFEILASRKALSLATPGETVRLWTLLQVSESSLTLFGFGDEMEKRLFQDLTSVKMIGGKVAISILRNYSAPEIIKAILAGRADLLAGVSGVGAKRAERICFELKPSFQKRYPDFLGRPSESEGMDFSSYGIEEAVLEALKSLGFSALESSQAIQSSLALRESESPWTEEELLQRALKFLQKVQTGGRG